MLPSRVEKGFDGDRMASNLRGGWGGANRIHLATVPRRFFFTHDLGIYTNIYAPKSVISTLAFLCGSPILGREPSQEQGARGGGEGG